jgi:serine/threonine protein kinase
LVKVWHNRSPFYYASSSPPAPGKIDPLKTIRLFRKVLDHLAFLHESGKSHGCLTPDCIFVSRNGDIEFRDDAISQSRNYFSPEGLLLIENEEEGISLCYNCLILLSISFLGTYHTTLNDIWAIGLIFLETLLGEPLIAQATDLARFRFLHNV